MRRFIAAVTAGLAIVAVAVPAHASPGATRTAASAAAQVARTVTLITGDRVTVTARGDASVQRAKGRAKVAFLTRQVRGHLYAIPSDALPLLRANRLDPRLFDVTQLAEWGYDDRRADLPLIVTNQPQVAGFAAATATRQLPSVNGVAMRARKSGEFWSSLTGPSASAFAAGKSKIWLDGLRSPALDVSVPLIGAPTAWQAGYTGAGISVAVLDTGIDTTHPDLAGKVVAQANFTEGEEDDRDLVGHGTHVASTVAGSGAASNGRYKGVAPDARLLSGKVCVSGGCAESWILAGMEWAAAQQHAKVVNLSLGGTDSPDVDPVEQAVNALTNQYGTLFVVAAGNDGADESVGTPASADAALAVAAFTKTDALATFSSRGPRVGDAAIKPDIAAPGVDITAANSKDGFLGEPGQPYLTLSGTSMATPHVAGSAAILAQRHPDWSPGQLKAALMGSARPNPAVGVFAQGAGRVDVARAINATVVADPPSLSFGRALWPHQDDVPVTHTVTYRNTGTAAVTLQLALDATGPGGRPAPGDMFTLSASTLAVPAGGTASVTATADPRAGDVDGAFTGWLTATTTAGGDAVTRLPLAIDRETEHYDVTITHLGRDGKPASTYFTDLLGMDTLDFLSPYDADGTVTVRVPKGRFTVATSILDLTKEPPGVTTLALPALDVSAARSVTLDARLGRPVSITVPRADAKPADVSIGLYAKNPVGWSGTGIGINWLDNVYTGQVGGDPETAGFLAKIGSQWTDGTPTSPYAYLLAWHERGRLPAGFTRRVTDRQLGTVRADHRAHASPTADTAYFSELPGVALAGFAVGIPLTVPGPRLEHYNTDDGVRWLKLFVELGENPEFPFPIPVSFTASQASAYKAGRQVDEVWNQAVYGPCFPTREVPDQWVTRLGDTLMSRAEVLCDSDGHLGSSELTSARTTIWRNGKKLGEEASPGFADFTLPAASARYRLEVDLTRGNPFTLATHSTTTWTFTSSHVDGDRPVPLPLTALRIAPPVDANNAVPGGSTYPVPVRVERQPDSGARANRDLTLEISYDDGKTWHLVPLVRVLATGVGLITHPNIDGFASIRARATDFAGNTVEQTIIHAYKITKR